MKKNINQAVNTHTLSKSEIIDILKDNSINEYLFEKANEVREKYVGNDVHLRGLIEFSNICKFFFIYCWLRKDNLKL